MYWKLENSYLTKYTKLFVDISVYVINMALWKMAAESSATQRQTNLPEEFGVLKFEHDKLCVLFHFSQRKQQVLFMPETSFESCEDF